MLSLCCSVGSPFKINKVHPFFSVWGFFKTWRDYKHLGRKGEWSSEWERKRDGERVSERERTSPFLLTTLQLQRRALNVYRTPAGTHHWLHTLWSSCLSFLIALFGSVTYSRDPHRRSRHGQRCKGELGQPERIPPGVCVVRRRAWECVAVSIPLPDARWR